MSERFNIGLLVKGEVSGDARSGLLRCVLDRVASLIEKPRIATTTNLQTLESGNTEWTGDVDSIPETNDVDVLVHLYSGKESSRSGSVTLQQTNIGSGITISIPTESLHGFDLAAAERLMQDLFHCVTHPAVLIGGLEQEIDLELTTFEDAVRQLFVDNSLTILVVGAAALLPQGDSESFICATEGGVTTLRHRFAHDRMRWASLTT